MKSTPTPIYLALKRNRLQQKDVAEELGVSRMTVLLWVHGRSVPTGTNLVRLVEYLQKFEPGISERELLTQLPVADVMSAKDEDAAVAGKLA